MTYILWMTIKRPHIALQNKIYKAIGKCPINTNESPGIETMIFTVRRCEWIILAVLIANFYLFLFYNGPGKKVMAWLRTVFCQLDCPCTPCTLVKLRPQFFDILFIVRLRSNMPMRRAVITNYFLVQIEVEKLTLSTYVSLKCNEVSQA